MLFPKFTSFSSKIKIKNKIKIGDAKKAGWGGSQTYEKINLQFWMKFKA
jgi:hypothetical protein